MARLNKYSLLRVVTISLSLIMLFGCTSRPIDPPVETTNTAKIDVTPALPENTPTTPVNTDNMQNATSTPTPVPTPDYPDITQQKPVDDEFFSDAAFLGNSLIDGFRLFSGLNTCDYYGATSMTVNGADDLINKMSEKQYGKVYILLGINEIGYDVDYFHGLYANMLDHVRDTQPDADIYIMSLTPVSEYKSSTSDTFNMKRVKAYNDSLYALAKEKDCWYLDICTALAGDDGFLPGNVTSDGVHFSAEHYKVWLEYLRTHYNPSGDAEENS